jgi:ribosomal protein S18 acetylase RimI-like enzyme
MPVTIREARLADAEAIARIHVAMWQHAYRGQMPDDLLDNISLERRLTWRTQMLSEPAPRSHALVAVEGETVVGFCDVGASREAGAGGSDGELYAIYVAPGTQGKGIGAALMDEGVRCLQAEGFTRATLWVLATNAPTIRFYERKGWAADGVEKVEHWNNFPLHELRYARDLTTLTSQQS